MDSTRADWKAVYLACSMALMKDCLMVERRVDLMDSMRAGSRAEKKAGSKAVYLACSTALMKDC